MKKVLMNTLPPVLVLGTDCLTGLQTARILWKKGVPVFGAAVNPHKPYCRTRTVRRTISMAELLSDPKAVLQQIHAAEGARPVLLACTDDAAWWMSNQRDQLRNNADFLLPSPETFKLLADKARFYRFAAEQKLPLPATRFITDVAELDTVLTRLSFPLIVKPPRRSDAWMKASGGLKILKVYSPNELRNTVPSLLAAAGELILQEYIRGPDTNTRELSVCLDAKSALLCGITLRKIRQWPPDIGTGSLCMETREDEVMDSGLELLQKLNYAGAGQLEFKQDSEDGRYYIVEMNAGRVALNFPLCEACGIEMIYTLYCAAAGLPLPQQRTVTSPGAKWICWKRDLAATHTLMRRRELTLRNWAASVRGHKWSADLCLYDPQPMLADLSAKLHSGLRHLFRRMEAAPGKYDYE